MKQQFVRDIKPGDVVDAVFVAAEKSLSHKKDGSPYLSLSLTDRTGSVKAVAWDDADKLSKGFGVGDHVRVAGRASEYRNDLQLIVQSITQPAPDTVDPADFLPATERDTDQMLDRLVKLSRTVKTPCLLDLFEAFWKDDDFVKGLKTSPAAKKMHHAYLGGLIEHTLSVALLADTVAGHYKRIDRDLLLAGAILHDIGKIDEFDYRGRIDYSDVGRLLSHIVTGVRMLDDKLAGLADFPDNTALLLRHLIVSHHGSREFGSPEPPKTLEAVLLHYLDEIDAKINGIRTFMDGEDPAQAWTSYHKVLERFFFKGRREQDA